MNKKNVIVIISLILTILFSSCEFKLGWETKIDTKDWKINISTKSDNNFSVWTEDLKDWAKKIKDEATDYIKKNSKFLSDFSTFEKIYEKASENISETWLKALETSTKFLEKKYKEQIEKNPEIKKSLNNIENIVSKAKEEIKKWKITEELKNNFTKIKEDIEKIKSILEK
jgi:uncharacterized protein YozE (UPF0346 family)